MKLRPLLAALALGALTLNMASAQDATPAAASAKTELTALVGKIRNKLAGGPASAESLAPELAEFDAILAKYPEKTDDTAQVLLMKATLYLQILNDETKGKEILSVVSKDYAATKPAAQATMILEQLSPEGKAKAAAAEAARKAKLDAIVGAAAPELNFIWSTKDGLKKLSDLKGQVVVLDFWATWCGPCIASFPQVREHVAHFKGSPVTFLGVTSIQGSVSGLPGGKVDTKGDPQKEMSLMPEFIKAKNMTWEVVISEEQVFNPDYGIQGIPYVAIIAPDGKVRHVGLHPGDPAAQISEKVEALLKEFNLPLPAAKS